MKKTKPHKSIAPGDSAQAGERETYREGETGWTERNRCNEEASEKNEKRNLWKEAVVVILDVIGSGLAECMGWTKQTRSSQKYECICMPYRVPWWRYKLILWWLRFFSHINRGETKERKKKKTTTTKLMITTNENKHPTKMNLFRRICTQCTYATGKKPCKRTTLRRYQNEQKEICTAAE